jgi:phosphoribosylglycinamide formyltransferase 1
MIPKRISLFASGSGTNAENIIRYFSDSNEVIIDSLFSNREDAYALVRARKLGVPAFVFSRNEFYNTTHIEDLLKSRNVDLIVLSGFLWLVPGSLIRNFRILNIHPALLPKYGGKGMYGHLVHEAVIANHDTESGITIHQVNEKYDEGRIVFQAKCSVTPGDTPDDVAEKVHQLEYKWFPLIIKQFLDELT